MIDKQARYLETHEWAKKGDGDIISVGLSDFAIEQLGDIVYMELPKQGDSITKATPFGVVESVKTAADMYAPISVSVIEVNDEITNNPDLLKTDAYGQGWLIKIEPSNADEFDTLMGAAAYEQFLEKQDH